MISRRVAALFLGSFFLAAFVRAGSAVWSGFDSDTGSYMAIDTSNFKSNFYSLRGDSIQGTAWTNERSHEGAGSYVLGVDFTQRQPTLQQNFWGVSAAAYLDLPPYDLTVYSGFSFYIYAESNFPDNGSPAYPLRAKFFLKTGNSCGYGGCNWYEGTTVVLNRNQWTRVTISTAASGATQMNLVYQLGVQILGGDYDHGTTRLFIDTLEVYVDNPGSGWINDPPAAPTSLSASNPNVGNRLDLSWTASAATDLDHYNVYRSTVPGFTPSSYHFITSVPGGTNSLQDVSVVDGITYRYRISSVDNRSLEGSYSAEFSGTSTGPDVFDLTDPVGDPAHGMTYAAWSNGAYLSVDSKSSLDDLMSTGANYVALLTTWYMPAYNSNTMSPDYANRTPTDAAMIQAIQDIHARGMKVLLKPHIDVNDGAWRGQIHPTNMTTWFFNYATFINHYADLAQANGVEMLCVGTELKTMTDTKFWSNMSILDNWTAVIDGVRSRYNGLLTYAANTGHPQDEFASIEFWDQLDVIGLNAWWKLTPDPNASLDYIKAGWSQNHDNYELAGGRSYIFHPLQSAADWSAFKGMDVIITELGARSSDGTNTAPADYTASNPIDLQEQSDVYEAGFSAWNHRNWVKGIFWWHWDPNPNGGGRYSDYYVPNDKPVLQTITRYYGGENTGNNFRYTFDSSIQEWTNDTSVYFSDNLGVPSASGPGHNGSPASLSYPLSFNDPGTGDIGDYAYVEPYIRKDLAEYRGLKAYVYVPNGAIADEVNNPLKVSLVVQTGDNYAWYESNTSRFLSSGQWREVSIDFNSAKNGSNSAVGQVVPNTNDIRRIGVSIFGAGATNGSNTIYIDNVVARATWTVLSLSLSTTDFWLFNAPPLGSTITLTSLDLENAGNANLRYSLNVGAASPTPWTPSATAPGSGVFVLNGMFNSTMPTATNFVEANHALTPGFLPASSSRFNGNQLGSGVPPGAVRNLWFEFRAPSITSTAETAPHQIPIGIMAELE